MLHSEQNKSMNDILNFFEGLVFVADRERLIDEIEMVKREIFAVNTAESLERSLKNKLPNSRATEFFLYLSHHMKSVYDGHVVGEILDVLRDRVVDLEVAHVRLATEISRQEAVELHEMLAQRLEKKILIDVQTESSLLGGLKLEFGGVYRDLSLSTMIKNILEREQLAT